MNEWTKLIFGIIAALFVAAILAVWKLVSGKANKVDIEVTTGNLIKDFDADIKRLDGRIDSFMQQLALGASKAELIDKLGSASTRADDKDLRVQRDIAELKADVKSMADKLTLVDKRLDELPARVASLELTRNQENRIKN